MPAALISIVMPTRNQAAFIEDSIASVLTQDYPNLELIVADGASSDGTQALLARLAEQDTRLRWFSEPDTGPAQAVNRAIAKARGTLLGWLNSDDLYTQGALSRAEAVLAADPSLLMVYGHGEHIDLQGQVLDAYPTLPPATPIAQFKEGCFICQPTVLFRRTMTLLNGKFDEQLQCAFDFDYWLRAFSKFQNRIGFVDAVQAQSRLHDACITQTQRWQVMYEGIKLLSEHLQYAPKEWVLTLVEELISGQAAVKDNLSQRDTALTLLEAVQPFLSVEDYQLLGEAIRQEQRLLG